MQQMQREQSEMDMNGNRPQSPASADNAPSPSKRPRLEGGAVNGQQLAPNGRGQGQMQGQQNPQQLMMPNGMQRAMNPAQFQQFQQGQAVQQKSMQVYAQNLALHHSRSALNSQGLPNGGMMNPGVMPNQADLVPMPDGQGGMYPMGPEYYNSNGQLQQVRPGMQTPGGQHGNHALQDYQMQLMLLEQQNKRRLMMARQEQDSMSRADGQPPMPGQGLPPGTSPQGSRAGASPNPSDQMKRGTPKMPQTGLPGSPSAGDMGQNRGSPASMALNGAQMPPDMAAAGFFPGPGGPMRPPSSNPAFTGAQMGQPIPANAGRLPSGQWQPGQPMPQHSPATQPQAGTPQDRSTMPPPQAPPAGANAGRPQPPSPQTTGNAPPTPQQSTKAAPKGKKEGAKENTRKVCDDFQIQLFFGSPTLTFLEHSVLTRRTLLLLPPPLPPLPRLMNLLQLRLLPSRLMLPTPSPRVDLMPLQLHLPSRPRPLHLPLWFSPLRTRASKHSMISPFLM